MLTQSSPQDLHIVLVIDPDESLGLVELHLLEVRLGERLLVVQHVREAHEEGHGKEHEPYERAELVVCGLLSYLLRDALWGEKSRNNYLYVM